MPYAERFFTCVTCGAPVRKRRPQNAEVRCIECSVERSVTNAWQLHGKYGEFYRKWAKGYARFGREAEALAELGDQIDSIG